MMKRKFQFLRRILCVILVFLFLAVLCGCRQGTSIPLSGAKEMEIIKAWEEKTGRGLSLGGWIYYGTYGDCVVFFQATHAQAETEKYTAGQEFIYGSSFVLHVYRNGEFMDLEQAYKKWYIPRSQVKEIWRHHKSLNEMWYD